MTTETIKYPNAWNCAKMVIHEWGYKRYPTGGVYTCARCRYSLTKIELKELTD